jgi:AraC-like DNA-binding protein
MALRPICEPVELPLGASVIAERVAIPADAPQIGRFMHFHDVAELVLFRHVRGEFVAGGRRHRLGEGAITFVPSMRRHDFALDPGAMDWVLVQVDPYIVESLAVGLNVARLSRPFCAWPDGAARERIATLADWLVEAAQSEPAGPATARIVELLLLAAAQAPERETADDYVDPAPVERLRPVLERLRALPAETMALGSAAAMCSLSPAYFSRRFRQVFGMTFSDYARIYRLHLAARRLVTTRTTVSEIAYGVGFSSPAHFAARFRDRFGMTPREYRNSAHTRAAIGEGMG